ncbi:MAG: 16S rRNA (cytosine(1402)-N(4))-methyltransferase RsmH [Candidatus Margulisiibacteriota bacterium]
MTHHIPVLLEPTLEGLDIQPNDHVVDGTMGFGGHSHEILQKLGPNGRLLGIDQDPFALAFCAEKFKNDSRVCLEAANFVDLATVLNKHPDFHPTKVLVDLGVSSYHIDSAGRGFSYLKDEPLDMRMNPKKGRTAADILNKEPAEVLIKLFKDFGELPRPEAFVNHIVSCRKYERLTHTSQLQAAIKTCFKFGDSRPKMLRIFAQIFQALRIAVNHELDILLPFLKTLETLPAGARIAIITFHSLEDRLIKHGVKDSAAFKPLTKHVIQATQDEIRANSRAKSAKLRIFERC